MGFYFRKQKNREDLLKAFFDEYQPVFQTSHKFWMELWLEMKILFLTVNQIIKYVWTSDSIYPKIAGYNTANVYSLKFLILLTDMLNEIQTAVDRNPGENGLPITTLPQLMHFLNFNADYGQVRNVIMNFSEDNREMLQQIRMGMFRLMYADILQNFFLGYRNLMHPSSKKKCFSHIPTNSLTLNEFKTNLDIWLYQNPYRFYSAPFFYIYYPDLVRDISFRVSNELIENEYSPERGRCVPDRFNIEAYYSECQKIANIDFSRIDARPIEPVYLVNVADALQKRQRDNENLKTKYMKKNGLSKYIPKSKRKKEAINTFTKANVVKINCEQITCDICSLPMRVIDGFYTCIECGQQDLKNGPIPESMPSRSSFNSDDSPNRGGSTKKQDTHKIIYKRLKEINKKFHDEKRNKTPISNIEIGNNTIDDNTKKENVGTTLLGLGLKYEQKDLFIEYNHLTGSYLDQITDNNDLKKDLLKIITEYVHYFFLTHMNANLNTKTFIKLNVLLASDHFGLFSKACDLFTTTECTRMLILKLMAFIQLFEKPNFEEFNKIRHKIRDDFIDEFAFRLFYSTSNNFITKSQLNRHLKYKNEAQRIMKIELNEQMRTEFEKRLAAFVKHRPNERPSRKMKHKIYSQIKSEYTMKLNFLADDVPGYLFRKFGSMQNCTEISLLNANFFAMMANISKFVADKRKSVFLFPKIVDVRSMRRLLKRFSRLYPAEANASVSKFTEYFSCESQIRKVEANMPALFATIAQRTLDPNRVYLQIWTAWHVYYHLRIEKPLENYNLKHEVCNLDLNEFLAIVHNYSKIYPSVYGKRFSVSKLVADINTISKIHLNSHRIYDIKQTGEFKALWDLLTIEVLVRTKLDVISLQYRIENTPYENAIDRISVFQEALKLSPKKRLILADTYIAQKFSEIWKDWIPDGNFWFGGNRQFVNRSTQRTAANIR